MRKIAIICSAIIGASLLAFPAVAQQKTIKACQEEWRANKADNQAKGITEKAYVTKCRGGEAAKPAPAPAEKKAAKPAPAEKKAAKPPKEKKTAAPASAPPPAQAPAQAPAPAPAKPAPTATAAPTGAYQYSNESQAKFRCMTGTVVWANLDSKIYHFAGHKSYGTTKTGAYMCESDATSQGMRAAKNEKHP
jgi:outer membrane biosynthesis protein TonB